MGQSNSEILVDRNFMVGYSPTVLTIKVHELYSISGQPSTEDLDDLSSINDGLSISGYGNSKSNFKSEVRINKNAKWLIDKSDPYGEDEDYELRLISITAKNPESSFFNENPLYVDQNNEIKGKVVKGSVDSIFNYNIKFLISDKNGEGIKVYSLDPQLQMGTSPR